MGAPIEGGRKETMKESVILISGYGAPGEEDLVLYRIGEEGQVRKLQGICHGRAPSFCCQGDNGWVYAASERPDGADVTAYRMEGEHLRPVCTLEVPGSGLCHLHAHKGILFGSCYESGHAFAVDAGVNRVLWQRHWENGHIHWAYTAGDTLYLADLGNDCVYRFSLDGGIPAGEPVSLRQPEGSGPRQIFLLEDGCMLCVNELDGTLRVWDRDGHVCAEEQASAEGSMRNWPGGMCGGDVLYVCNRGPNTMAAWRWEEGRLKIQGEWPTGNWPRHAAVLRGTGHLAVACMRGNEVHGYAWAKDGLGESFSLPLAGASCVLELAGSVILTSDEISRDGRGIF